MSNDLMRHDCSRDGCWRERHAVNDWSALARQLPRGIVPTDVDGLTEVNGRFLLIEFKQGDAWMSRGQQMAFERLPKEFTVFIVQAGRMNPRPQPTRLWTMHRGRVQGPADVNEQALAAAMGRWAMWADRYPIT